MLRTLSLQFLSVVTGSYVSGTYSIVFVNCPNEQIARDIARYGKGLRYYPRGSGATRVLQRGHFGTYSFAFDNPICPVRDCTPV